MSLSLSAYIDSLDERKNFIWPASPPPVPMKVTPFLAPLQDIKCVLWNVYGTLLEIDQGELRQDHSQKLRMQIALDKTIHEFNMWYSMSRKPGQPWEYMLRQYMDILDKLKMTAVNKGEIPEVDSTKIWGKLIDRLLQNEYKYDVGQYGAIDDLAQKVAYFFHANLQGVSSSPGALSTLRHLTASGIKQGLLADGQCFTIPQLVHALKTQGPLSGTEEVLNLSACVLSLTIGVRKPSASLYKAAKEAIKGLGLKPEQVLYVSHVLKDDLAITKPLGFKTALFAADKNTCRVTSQEMKDPKLKPDRLISELSQVAEIVGC